MAAAPPADPSGAMRGGFIPGPQGRLFLRRLGSGGACPLLMVHGGPDWDHGYLRPVAERLARHRRVALIDLRGCGRSDPTADGTYGVEAAAEDLRAALARLGPKAHLLGFSFGGRVALAAARAAPGALASLVLASSTPGGPPPGWDPEPPERAARRARTPDLRAALAAVAEPDAAFTRKLALDGLAMDVFDLAALPRIAAIVGRGRFTGHWGAALKAGRLVADPRDHRDWLRTAPMPRLVLHGAEDYRFPLADWTPLARAPGLTLAPLPATGHLAPLERPDAWLAALERFLAAAEAGLAADPPI